MSKGEWMIKLLEKLGISDLELPLIGRPDKPIIKSTPVSSDESKFIIIAHKGNLEGPNSKTENTQDQIRFARKSGFDVEFDLWAFSEYEFCLGHDAPNYDEPVADSFIRGKNTKFWLHAKNFKAAEWISNHPNVNGFSHENDPYVFTSQGWIWLHPDHAAVENLNKRTIVVMPERTKLGKDIILEKAGGICTDYPFEYSLL